MPTVNVISSHRHTATTGAVTLIAAGTATAGHILCLRNPSTTRKVRLRVLEVEFILTTAFGAAQEVGFDASIARSYTADHTAGTAITVTGGRVLAAHDATVLTGRTASTAALTAGTHTLDTNAIARGSLWASTVGATLTRRCHDFTDCELGGIGLGQDEGIIGRNTILMGAAGVGKWHFTAEFDDVIVS
jgi:hypothetical protein